MPAIILLCITNENTLEHLKKAYGKELLNGINHFKLSNYPLDFFL